MIANRLSRVIVADPPSGLVPDAAQAGGGRRGPAFGWVMFVVLLPVVLMLFKAAADVGGPSGSQWRTVAEIVGQPLVALLAGLLVGMVVLGIGARLSPARVGDITGKGLPVIAGVVLIVAAGGGLGGVLRASGVGGAIGDLVRSWGLPLLPLGWLLAAIIRIAVGSGTVAIVTAISLLEPLARGLSPARLSPLVLAIGAGSRFFSHVNDAGFWLVKEYMGLSLQDTFKYWTMLDCIISVVALGGVMLFELVFA